MKDPWDTLYAPDSNGSCEGYRPEREYQCYRCKAHFESIEPEVLGTDYLWTWECWSPVVFAVLLGLTITGIAALLGWY